MEWGQGGATVGCAWQTRRWVIDTGRVMMVEVFQAEVLGGGWYMYTRHTGGRHE